MPGDCGEFASSTVGRCLSIGELEAGMVLSSDLLTNDGRLLLAKGTKLEGQIIGALQRLHSYGVIVGRVAVRYVASEVKNGNPSIINDECY